MPFSAPFFIFLFLPIVLGIYYITPEKFKNILLLFASIIFYAWGEGKFTLVILSLVFFNYRTAISINSSIDNKSSKKSLRILILAITINLIFLFYYKYSFFFIINLINLFNLSLAFKTTLSSIYLPLAISFFVFHAISYNIDVFKKKVVAEKKFFNLALYLLFFPHLLSGPILRYKNIAEQLISRVHNLDNFSYGVTRFIVGLGKKVIIADTLAITSDEIFAIPVNHLSTGEAWLGIISFTLQIYFDFSGYSDMAIGLARMFGFKFPENFNYPYISTSIGEFWTRWHITLSNWFRDYLYIPLGGSRCSPLRNFLNLWIVFLLVGLWHGAGWNFIIWGALQGTLLIIERINNNRLIFWKPIRHLCTMLAVMVGWVFFRSENLSYAFGYLGRMLNITNNKAISAYHPLRYFLQNDILICIILGIIFSTPAFPLLGKLIMEIKKTAHTKLSFCIEIIATNLKFAFLLVLLFLSLITVAIQTYNPFLYFRF